MSDKEMIAEFLAKNKAKELPCLDEDIDTPQDYRRSKKTYNQLHEDKIVSVQKNIPRKGTDKYFEDSSALDAIARIKPADKLDAIGEVFLYEGKEVKIIDFEIFVSKNTGECIDRYVGTHGYSFPVWEMEKLLGRKQRKAQKKKSRKKVPEPTPPEPTWYESFINMCISFYQKIITDK